MELTKNSRVIQRHAQKEKWFRYLLQHLNKKKPAQTELESLIHWTETTCIEPKQVMSIMEDTKWSNLIQ